MIGHHIRIGQVWRNKASGNHATVTQVDDVTWGYVKLHQHKTNRDSKTQVHYFLYNYELIGSNVPEEIMT